MSTDHDIYRALAQAAATIRLMEREITSALDYRPGFDLDKVPGFEGSDFPAQLDALASAIHARGNPDGIRVARLESKLEVARAALQSLSRSPMGNVLLARDALDQIRL